MRVAVALVLAAAALGGWLALRSPEREAAAPASAPQAAAPPAAPLPAPPGNDVRVLALNAIEARAQGRAREAEDAAGLLRGRLQQEPRLWTEVVDVLCSIDDPKTVIHVTASLAEAVEPASEALFIDLLRSGPTAHARRAAAAALMTRRSPESLEPLVAAARSDPDRAVRMDALKALAIRRDHASSPEGAAAISDVFARRAQGEPDPELRTMARRLSGEAVPGEAVPPPPPRRARPKLSATSAEPR